MWLSVWDWDRFGRNQFLGEVRLPLSSADLDDKEDHWHTLQDRVRLVAGGMYLYVELLNDTLKYGHLCVKGHFATCISGMFS